MEKATFLKLLGQNIASLRLAKGWSQTDLANACDKDRQTLHKVENGQVNVSVYFLKQIAEALEIPVYQILVFK
ncbi:helix-turn-helix domain-containing protein [Spirosoma agri]|uniref:Helix-turn-helix transcriptional regulator n=1 Tax=Spirosoma agri TaxID=1987381 RepID=A0A6M0ICL9_9BACT|nr:helix-turn-helix transcriptional regulator [Spirosoma agri]NEU65949.1 helix-turn-helix transcriptional regulator [Spirosoma agri]